MAKLDKQSANPAPGQIKHDDHSFGVLDTSSYDTKGTATTSDDVMFFGTGNSPANYNITIDDKTHIELALKIHDRQGPDYIPVSRDADGTAHYEVAAGYQPGRAPSDAPVTPRVAWNFDFSVNTGLDGSARTLDNFDFRIIIKSGDGEQAIFDLQHTGPGNTPWLNTTHTGAFSDEDGSNPQLSQNSVNLGFGFFSSVFGSDVANAGETYDITLQAFDHGKLVAQVHDALLLV